MAGVTLKKIHEELLEIRDEITELKELLASEPRLRKETIRKISEARERVKKSYVPHDKVTSEFL